MKLDSLIKMFLPREERFHELLERDTQNLVRSAELFLEIARSTRIEDRRVKLVELKALEHEGRRDHPPGLRGAQQLVHHAARPRGHPLDRGRPRRHPRLPRGDRALPGHLRDRRGAGAAHPLRRDPARDDPPDRLRHPADLGPRQRAPGARIELVRISELENQGDDLYLTVIADLFRADSGNDADRDHEVEGDLPEPRGRLRLVQGLHAHRRQRGDQERLSRPALPR